MVILIYVKFAISIISLLMFPHVIDFSLPANDGDLLVGDHHEFPLPEGPLRLEILHKHLRGNLLRVERLGEPIYYISGVTYVFLLRSISFLIFNKKRIHMKDI